MDLMNKSEILKTFMSKGHQIDTESLDFFLQNPGSLETFLDKMKESQKVPLNITKDFIENLLKVIDQYYQS